MDVKYVVSIAGQLLYFDAERQPTEQIEPKDGQAADKPEITLIPPAQRPAAQPEWDDALAQFSSEQREAAEISETA